VVYPDRRIDGERLVAHRLHLHFPASRPKGDRFILQPGLQLGGGSSQLRGRARPAMPGSDGARQSAQPRITRHGGDPPRRARVVHPHDDACTCR